MKRLIKLLVLLCEVKVLSFIDMFQPGFWNIFALRTKSERKEWSWCCHADCTNNESVLFYFLSTNNYCFYIGGDLNINMLVPSKPANRFVILDR